MHGALAVFFKDRLKSGDCTAAEVGVIRQFLRDNGISCIGEDDGNMTEIYDNIAHLPSFKEELQEEFGGGMS